MGTAKVILANELRSSVKTEVFKVIQEEAESPTVITFLQADFTGMSNHVDVGLTFVRVTHASNVMQVPWARSQAST